MKEILQGRVRSELEALGVFDFELKRLQQNIETNSKILTELKAKNITHEDASVKQCIDNIIQDSFKVAPLYQDYVAKIDILGEHKILATLMDVDLELTEEQDAAFKEITKKDRMFAVQAGSIIVADKEQYDLHSQGMAEKLRTLDYEKFYNSPRFEKPSN